MNLISYLIIISHVMHNILALIIIHQHHHPFTNVVKVHNINIKRQNIRSCSYFMQSSTVIKTITDSISSTDSLMSSSSDDPFIDLSSYQHIITGGTNDAALVESTSCLWRPLSKDDKINNHLSSSNHFDFTHNINVLRKSAVSLCIALITSCITSSNEVVLAASMEPTHQSSLEMNILPVALEPDIVDLDSLKIFRVSVGC